MLQRNNIRPDIAVMWLKILLPIWLPISDRRSVVLIEGFRGIPQSVQANAGIEPQIINLIASEHCRIKRKHFTACWV
jgi:hypothetical protein